MADKSDGDGCPVTVTWSTAGTTTQETITEVIMLSYKACYAVSCRLKNILYCTLVSRCTQCYFSFLLLLYTVHAEESCA